MKATEVFTPGSFPAYTYVEREEQRLEDRLRDGLDTPGQIISVAGPSKSGKTVLVERVVGPDLLITITGAGIAHPDHVWERILDWMDVPQQSAQSSEIGATGSVSTKAKGSIGIPGIAKGEGGLHAEGRLTGKRGREAVRGRRGMNQVVEEIADSDFVVLIDDFHYMPRDVQDSVAKQIKEAARLGVRIVTASVPHRSDDVVRANPELRGRVLTIDLDYWGEANLTSIAEKGFGILNASVDDGAVRKFVRESAGSPQLMQQICLNASFELGLRRKLDVPAKLDVPPEVLDDVFERTASTTDFRSLVDVLDSGPKTRGTERKTYRFDDGSEGDVYRCVLKAMAQDPPQLSFPYGQIVERVGALCEGAEPVGSSITGTCSHMAKLALEKFPRERVIDWDEQKQVLDLPDPYLLFYLRWSGRLMEPEV